MFSAGVVAELFPPAATPSSGGGGCWLFLLVAKNSNSLGRYSRLRVCLDLV